MSCSLSRGQNVARVPPSGDTDLGRWVQSSYLYTVVGDHLTRNEIDLGDDHPVGSDDLLANF